MSPRSRPRPTRCRRRTSRRGSMRRGSMRRGSMRRGSTRRASTRRGSMRRGSTRRTPTSPTSNPTRPSATPSRRRRTRRCSPCRRTPSADDEIVTASTGNTSGFFYVRVQGHGDADFDAVSTFGLERTTSSSACEGLVSYSTVPTLAADARQRPDGDPHRHQQVRAHAGNAAVHRLHGRPQPPGRNHAVWSSTCTTAKRSRPSRLRWLGTPSAPTPSTSSPRRSRTSRTPTATPAASTSSSRATTTSSRSSATPTPRASGRRASSARR